MLAVGIIILQTDGLSMLGYVVGYEAIERCALVLMRTRS